MSGNHAKTRDGRRTADARLFDARVSSIAKAAALAVGWQMPDYVAVDLTIYNCRIDRDNVAKEIMDPLEGVVFAFDSRVLDGRILKMKDKRGPRVEVVAQAIDGSEYGYRKPR